MLRKMMRAKIHRATITGCNPDYVGSITIDADLLRASGIRPNEAVLVLDVDNAARFETYVIRGEPGSGVIAINGAAARLVEVGHKVLVVCFGLLNEDELEMHEAKVVLVDDVNQVSEQLIYPSVVDPQPVSVS